MLHTTAIKVPQERDKQIQDSSPKVGDSSRILCTETVKVLERFALFDWKTVWKNG